jgi:phenylpropionate dioxygenase-like ring-hydroxylating dioxygenase large terminal subunit
VPAEEYLSPARFEAERRAVFGRVPQVVAVAAELAEPGACLAASVGGIDAILLRGEDGAVRAFRNACRHRATRLVSGDEPSCRKALVCPYHGWTYDLSGRLLHVPRREAFDGLDEGRDGLIPLHAEERHGLVWAAPEPFALADFLAPIDAELGELELGRGFLFRRSVREVRANWKLILDAFLDVYHVRHLHRDSLYPYFLDSHAEVERAGPHIRALAARRALLEVRPEDLAASRLRDLVSPTFQVFPNSNVVLHPDYVSVMTSVPLAVGATRFVHRMFLAAPPRSEAERAHFERSFALIDGGVFGREDLGAVEAMQRGLESGADATVLIGRHEHAILWFHEAVAAALAAPR